MHPEREKGLGWASRGLALRLALSLAVGPPSGFSYPNSTIHPCDPRACGLTELALLLPTRPRAGLCLLQLLGPRGALTRPSQLGQA